MTFDEFDLLKKYLKSETNASYVGYGNNKTAEQLTDGQKPAILIIADDGGTIDEVKNQRFNTFDMQIKLQIIDVDDVEKLIRTLRIMDDLMRVIREFNEQKGHYLLEEFTTEYTDNNYIITYPYMMRFRQHNTG